MSERPSFFDSFPQPEPPGPNAQYRPRPRWLGPPDATLGGIVPLNCAVAKTERLSVAITSIDAYPLGIMVHVVVHDRLEQHSNDRTPFHVSFAEFKFGLLMSDGQRSIARNRYFNNALADLVDSEQPPEPILLRGVRDGGHRLINMNFWAAPLPPAGPLQMYVEWKERGLSETSITIDANSIRKAAMQSRSI